MHGPPNDSRRRRRSRTVRSRRRPASSLGHAAPQEDAVVGESDTASKVAPKGHGVREIETAWALPGVEEFPGRGEVGLTQDQARIAVPGGRGRPVEDAVVVARVDDDSRPGRPGDRMGPAERCGPTRAPLSPGLGGRRAGPAPVRGARRVSGGPSQSRTRRLPWVAHVQRAADESQSIGPVQPPPCWTVTIPCSARPRRGPAGRARPNTQPNSFPIAIQPGSGWADTKLTQARGTRSRSEVRNGEARGWVKASASGGRDRSRTANRTANRRGLPRSSLLSINRKGFNR